MARALSRGLTSQRAVIRFSLLMFALEPSFERRFRIREWVAGFDSLQSAMVSPFDRSHPGCWYRCEPAAREHEWLAMTTSDAALTHPATPLGDPDFDDALPHQLSDSYLNQRDVPFVATPREDVRAMLELAAVGETDVVFDLGCGDGRIVVTAAQELGARGVGIDIDPDNIAAGRAAAAAAGVSGQVTFVQADLHDADFSDATVVTLFLLGHVNLELRDRLRRDLRPGARVVSRHFDMGDWKPDGQTGSIANRIYRWSIE